MQYASLRYTIAMVGSISLIKLNLEVAKTLRCIVFVWQLSIVNALGEFVNVEKIVDRYVIQHITQ